MIQNLEKYLLYLKLISAAEDFLKKNNYLKLDLPVLVPSLIPESYLEIFETEFRYFDQKKKLYLTPSPEALMKKLISQGIGDCYYLDKAFRNAEPTSSLHSPEFTILEFYKINQDYNFMKKEIKKLFIYICQELFHQNFVKYKNNKIDFTQWEEISVVQAFNQFCHLDSETLFSHNKFFKAARSKGYNVNKATYVDLFCQIYSQEIEPHLGMNGHPTIISDYPKEMAALAKLNDDGRTAQRFEFYIAGVELGDCYTELTDWKEQKKRFKEEIKIRQKSKKINHLIDWDFINVLKKGSPNCAGLALGVERMAMIFTDITTLQSIKLVNLVIN